MRFPWAVLAAAASFGSAEAVGDDAKPTVYTTFYPTTYFAERIAGDRVDVVCPLPDDADPIFWKPGRDVVQAYQTADLVIANGARFEKWIERVSLPTATLVSTAEPFHDRWIELETEVVHSHGKEGEHSHKGVDGHTWLDPILAASQAREILLALKRVCPGYESDLEARFTALEADLLALDGQFRALGRVADGTWLYASHPAYNYVARRYGWPVVSLDLDPEEMPADEAFAATKARLEEKPARFLLWEGPPLPAIAKRVKDELGLESIVFSPCESLDAEARQRGEDYLDVMKANMERVQIAFPSARSDRD